MLIFFKPWRHAKDLREQDKTWSESFKNFTESCQDRFNAIMENMQILHECRDSRDDHFADRRNRRRCHVGRSTENYAGRTNTQDDFGDEDGEDLILEHLQSIDQCCSQRKLGGQEDALTCLQ